GSVAVLHAVQAAAAAQSRPRLLLVTRGAVHVPGDAAPVAVLQAPLWGLGRVIVAEHPELRCAVVDLDAAPAAHEADALLRECLADDGEAEVALRGPRRYVARLEPQSLERLREAQVLATPRRPGQAFHLDAPKAGALDRLVLRAAERRPPGPGEVEIEAASVGLNFRDVMKALGIYPTEGDEPLRLGDECAGTVVAVGEGVSHLRVGDRVVAIAAGFGSHATVASRFAVPLPAHLGFDEGATLPIAFLTASYALHRLARLHKGERVLIHAAAGGVGLAAVALAQRAGAEIFATAGSPDKREYLRSLGVEHVMDSRSLDFADEVLAATGGEGVDVVLNSLAGEAIPRSLGLLRAYGRFLEIGKTDIYQDHKLGLWPFRNNLSYFAIDLARLFQDRPEVAGELLRELMACFERRELSPLPHRVFPIAQAEAAFRHMAQARHIGKIVLSLREAGAPVAARSFRPFPFRADGTYLVSGGLGGFGLAVARWMVEHGARHLVLLGRRGAGSDAARAAVAALGRQAEVSVVEADVTDEARVAEVLAQARAAGPPLRGVLHAAMVLDDGLLAQLDAARVRRVLAPK
ncbi:MAG TPA: SDR family NAD(P)-dependent oxidoreductase, partial [Methylomirabilota bacterium]|nr:SDR family NAD(P)-dependent oxidoreductase [Methylomirabilota bacterium]